MLFVCLNLEKGTFNLQNELVTELWMEHLQFLLRFYLHKHNTQQTRKAIIIINPNTEAIIIIIVRKAPLVGSW